MALHARDQRTLALILRSNHSKPQSATAPEDISGLLDTSIIPVLTSLSTSPAAALSNIPHHVAQALAPRSHTISTTRPPPSWLTSLPPTPTATLAELLTAAIIRIEGARSSCILVAHPTHSCVLMSAQHALDFGIPIYAALASTDPSSQPPASRSDAGTRRRRMQAQLARHDAIDSTTLRMVQRTFGNMQGAHDARTQLAVWGLTGAPAETQDIAHALTRPCALLDAVLVISRARLFAAVDADTRREYACALKSTLAQIADPDPANAFPVLLEFANTAEPHVADALRAPRIAQCVREHFGARLGVGVDVELVADINVDNECFVDRNFTRREQLYCRSRPDPRASFAGRWCAKEAVIKAVSSLNLDIEKVWTRGSGAPLVDIEVLGAASGAPRVVLHGEVKDAVAKAGVAEVKVSISHIDTYAIATALAT